MGLEDVVGGEVNPSVGRYKKYSKHEAEDKLVQWAEEYSERFPGGVEPDFIEVSPEMTRTHGYAYWKPDGACYIRIAEKVIENYTEEYQRRVLLHEMCHIWFYKQNMRDIDDNTRLFNWVLGRVGADVSGVGPEQDEYEVIEKFVKHSEDLE